MIMTCLQQTAQNAAFTSNKHCQFLYSIQRQIPGWMSLT